MPARPRPLPADALRLLAAALCAVLLSALAGAPAAQLSARRVALPHVDLTTMVKLSILGGLVSVQT